MITSMPKTDKRAYWMWLQRAFSYGSSKPKSICNRFDSIEEFYEGGIACWSRMSFISEGDVTSLSGYSLEQAEITLEYCEKMGYKVITPECEDYPELLWNIPDPPAVLYMRGDLPDLDKGLPVAIVGSRKTSDIMIKEAEKLSYEMSKSGANIISGGAVGVDTAAHRGAMMGGTPTIAVLGCGLDYPYLMENELLRQKIVSKGGALITEYPPNMGVQKGTFQTRNRIISGLSKGVLIVSAAKKSGTMITARRATEQNRDIFAVPGSPLIPTSEGPNSLIKDGAVPVTNGYDIIEYYGNVGVHKPAQTESGQISFKDEVKSVLPSYISKEGKMIFGTLEPQPKHISEISFVTGLRPSQILTAVTELELCGIIQSYSGQRYSLKEK